MLFGYRKASYGRNLSAGGTRSAVEDRIRANKIDGMAPAVHTRLTAIVDSCAGGQHVELFLRLAMYLGIDVEAKEDDD